MLKRLYHRTRGYLGTTEDRATVRDQVERELQEAIVLFNNTLVKASIAGLFIDVSIIRNEDNTCKTSVDHRERLSLTGVNY